MNPPRNRSHGTGEFTLSQFKSIGSDCVFEAGVMVFHPETITLGHNVYVGHQTILKGYYRNEFSVGDYTWIGQQCFFHSAGGLTIGARVGIGPGVKIITSSHTESGRDTAVLFSPIDFAPVFIEDDCDLGVGSIILPGVTVGRGAVVGAGSVVTRTVQPFTVVAGSPARFLRTRP